MPKMTTTFSFTADSDDDARPQALKIAKEAAAQITALGLPTSIESKRSMDARPAKVKVETGGGTLTEALATVMREGAVQHTPEQPPEAAPTTESASQGGEPAKPEHGGKGKKAA